MTSCYPGDDIIPDAVMVYDRKRMIKAIPAQVFPWLVQLGSGRAGWYLTTFWETFIPISWRAARRIHPQWQNLQVGDRVEDYKMGMGEGEYFIVESIASPSSLVYTSKRLGTIFTWTLMCHPVAHNAEYTEVHLRFRGSVHRTGWQRTLLVRGDDFVDWVFTQPMLNGLAERCEHTH